jgi:hypothetical protein
MKCKLGPCIDLTSACIYCGRRFTVVSCLMAQMNSFDHLFDGCSAQEAETTPTPEQGESSGCTCGAAKVGSGIHSDWCDGQ